MASVYGYIVMIVGLSILLGMAGVMTTGGHVLSNFITVTVSPTGGTYTTDFSLLNAIQNNFWSIFGGLLGLGAAVTIGIAFATRDVGQTLKSGLGTILGSLALLDMVSFITFATTIGTLGYILGFISLVIYLPLLVGFIIAMANWVGGAQ